MDSRKFAKAQSNGSSPLKIPPKNNIRSLQKRVKSVKQRQIEIPKIKLKANGK